MIRAARTVYLVALSLWTGGLAAISFIVAPAAFKTAPSRQIAGQMVGACLRNFGKVEIVCGILAFFASLLLYIRRPAGTRQGFTRVILVFLMLVLAISYVSWAYPDAAATRLKLEQMPDDVIVQEHFARIHRLSVILVMANIFLGSGLLICAGARSADGP